jgi:hypothetical protein
MPGHCLTVVPDFETSGFRGVRYSAKSQTSTLLSSAVKVQAAAALFDKGEMDPVLAIAWMWSVGVWSSSLLGAGELPYQIDRLGNLK